MASRFYCVLLLVLACALPVLVRADEGDPFLFAEQNAPLRLQIPGSGGWNAQCATLEPYGGIIYPGQMVSLTLEIHNTSKDKALAGTPTLEIVRFGSKLEKEGGKPGDFMAQGNLISYAPLGTPVRVEKEAITLQPGEKATLSWKQASANDFAAFGAYLVLVDLAGVGRQPAATFARCHPYNVKDTGDGKGSPLFWSLHYLDPPGQLKIASAVGYRWIRTDGFPNWSAVDGNFPRVTGPFDWTKQEKEVDLYRQLGLWIQSNMYGVPGGTVSSNNWKAYNYVNDAQYDYRWGDFVEEAVRRYCGADGNGPLQIIDFWNEPWEGGGISAWKSDSIRYRQLFKILHDRAHLGSSHIVVGGASSIMNSEDKFMTVANWQENYRLDVLSDHYVQPYCSFGPRIAKQLGVSSIETETWIGFDEHQLVGVATHFMAAGQSKVNCNHPVQLTWRNGDAGLMPKPTIMGANSFLYFVGARPFTRILFHNRLPWLYEYGSGKDAVFVLSGDRRLLNPAAVTMFDQIHADGAITVDAAGGKIQAYDIYGNTIPAVDGKYTLPLSRQSVYLQAPGADEAVVINAVRDAPMTGIKPATLALQDFVTPLTSGAALAVDINNVLSCPLAGQLTVIPPAGCTLADARPLAVTLTPGETKRVTVQVKAVTADRANAYPVTVRFTSNAGTAALTEVLHVNMIARATPVLNDDPSTWKAMPMLLHGAALKRDATIAAWRPWEKEQDVKGGLAEVRFQYDEDNIYIAVRERTEKYTPKPRLSTDPEQQACFGTGDMAHTYVKGIEDTAPYCGNCLQVGFGVSNFRLLPPMPEVPERMLAMEDTDYEYAIWGTPDGGSEIWRSVTPRMKFFHFLPRCMPAGYDGVPHGAKAVVRRVGTDSLYTVAIPLGDMPELRARPGQEIRIALRLPASQIELGFGRSATRSNGLTLLPRWDAHASNEVRWAFGK